jgi:hypothetical protein
MMRALLATIFMVGLLFAGVVPAKAAIVIGGLLLLTRRVKSRRIYNDIDWSLLLMFAGLFIIVGAAQNALLTVLGSIANLIVVERAAISGVILDRYRGKNGNFVRVLGLDSRSFEADRAGEGIEIVDNALIKAIELRSVFGVQANITADRAENAGSKRGIDALEEFQKDEAN